MATSKAKTREASGGAFGNFTDNGDRIVFTTGLRLINYLRFQITPQAPSFRAG
ncbi:MAG: hypothetical protein ACFFGZ_11375 [Candidatus Thorarchaeota archaeon]